MASKLGSGKILGKKQANIRRIDSFSSDVAIDRNRVKHTKNTLSCKCVNLKPKLDPIKQNQPIIAHITNKKASLTSGWSVAKVLDLDLEVKNPTNVFDGSFPVRKSNSS